jgi:hypothetical protein
LEILDGGEIKATSHTYREFAGTYGIHRTTVYRWANDLKRPSLVRDLEKLERCRIQTDSPKTAIEGFGVDKSRTEIPCEPSDMLLAYGDQYFYFSDENALQTLIESAARELNLDSLTEAIPQLLARSQMLGLDASHFTHGAQRITGESLSFLWDILGLPIGDLEGRIVKITGANGQGGIFRPKFLSGMKLEIQRARLIGIAVSDCHIPPSGSLHLCEESLDRINRVKELLDSFGVAYSETSVRRRKGDFEFYIASPLTKALQFWGIPPGDRTILNYGMPAEALDWSPDAKRGYLQEMFAQEGNVDKNGVINWARSHALYDEKKGTRYRFQSKLSEKAMDFIIWSKRMRHHHGIVNEKSIPIGTLRRLSEKEEADSRIASELLEVIQSYRNKLIDDETSIVKHLGIDVSLKPVRISYFEKSCRITVRWQARIFGYESKLRSALILAPNHDVKLREITNWLIRQPRERVIRLKRQLASEGFQLNA